MPTTFQPMLSTEAAQHLGVSADTVRLWERNGVLHAIRTAGGVRLFERSEIERLAEERRTVARAKRGTGEMSA